MKTTEAESNFEEVSIAFDLEEELVNLFTKCFKFSAILTMVVIFITPFFAFPSLTSPVVIMDLSWGCMLGGIAVVFQGLIFALAMSLKTHLRQLILTMLEINPIILNLLGIYYNSLTWASLLVIMTYILWFLILLVTGDVIRWTDWRDLFVKKRTKQNLPNTTTKEEIKKVNYR